MEYGNEVNDIKIVKIPKPLLSRSR